MKIIKFFQVCNGYGAAHSGVAVAVDCLFDIIMSTLLNIFLI